MINQHLISRELASSEKALEPSVVIAFLLSTFDCYFSSQSIINQSFNKLPKYIKKYVFFHLQFFINNAINYL